MKKFILFLIIFIEIFFILYLLFNTSILGYVIYYKPSTNSTPEFIDDYSKIFRSSNNSLLMNELIPYAKANFDGYVARLERITTIKINSDGFRDYEYSIIKPNNTFRIVVLGDSFTFGQGVESNETYPKILESKLNSLNNDMKYEVLNFGIPGYSFYQYVELFITKGLKYDSDMVIIEYLSINDLINMTEFRINYRDYKAKFNKTNLSSYDEAKRYVSYAREYQKEFEKKHFNESWKIVKIYSEKLFNLTQKNITVVIVTFFASDSEISYWKEIVNEKNWHLIIVKFDVDKDIIPNDCHPNIIGHKKIADKIYNYLIGNNLVPLSLNELNMMRNDN